MLEPENVELWKPREYPHEKIVQLKYYIKS